MADVAADHARFRAGRVTAGPPPVYVVGPSGHARSASLHADLADCGLAPVATVGVDLRAGAPGRVEEWVDQRAARVLQRRELTWGEIGCALGHRWAAGRARGRARTWALVLEDDACLRDGFRAAIDAICGLEIDRATVVLLYVDPHAMLLPRRWPWRTPLPALRRVATPPHGAVGYLMNGAALATYPGSGPVTSVADWPYPWSTRVSFLAWSPAAVAVGVAPSLIGEPRERAWGGLAEPRATRAARLVGTVAGLRYLRHHRIYRTWRGYRRRELTRLLVLTLRAVGRPHARARRSGPGGSGEGPRRLG